MTALTAPPTEDAVKIEQASALHQIRAAEPRLTASDAYFKAFPAEYGTISNAAAGARCRKIMDSPEGRKVQQWMVNGVEMRAQILAEKGMEKAAAMLEKIDLKDGKVSDNVRMLKVCADIFKGMRAGGGANGAVNVMVILGRDGRENLISQSDFVFDMNLGAYVHKPTQLLLAGRGGCVFNGGGECTGVGAGHATTEIFRREGDEGAGEVG